MDWTAVAQKLQSRRPGPAEHERPCAVLALLWEDELFLEVRSPLLRTQPGQVCLPGGRIEPGETPVACALRETEEELGIPAAAIKVLGQLDYYCHTTGQIVYPVLARLKTGRTEPLRPSPAEVAEVFTVPLDWFRTHPASAYEYRLQSGETDGLPPQLKQWVDHAPNRRSGVWWQYEDKLIWGLTAKVILQLLTVTS